MLRRPEPRPPRSRHARVVGPGKGTGSYIRPSPCSGATADCFSPAPSPQPLLPGRSLALAARSPRVRRTSTRCARLPTHPPGLFLDVGAAPPHPAGSAPDPRRRSTHAGIEGPRGTGSAPDPRRRCTRAGIEGASGRRIVVHRHARRSRAAGTSPGPRAQGSHASTEGARGWETAERGVGGRSPPQRKKSGGGWVGREPRAARARPGRTRATATEALHLSDGVFGKSGQRWAAGAPVPRRRRRMRMRVSARSRDRRARARSTTSSAATLPSRRA